LACISAAGLLGAAAQLEVGALLQQRDQAGAGDLGVAEGLLVAEHVDVLLRLGLGAVLVQDGDEGLGGGEQLGGLEVAVLLVDLPEVVAVLAVLGDGGVPEAVVDGGVELLVLGHRGDQVAEGGDLAGVVTGHGGRVDAADRGVDLDPAAVAVGVGEVRHDRRRGGVVVVQRGLQAVVGDVGDRHRQRRRDGTTGSREQPPHER
jgi:hypothetical protein